jgi:hypothetical protein
MDLVLRVAALIVLRDDAYISTAIVHTGVDDRGVIAIVSAGDRDSSDSDRSHDRPDQKRKYPHAGASPAW